MWVPSFLWAKRKFPWNAEHIRIASVGSAPPQVRRQPGAQPLWWDWTPSCSFPCSCRACDWMFPKSCVPQSFNPWWQCKYHRWLPFIVNFNRKVSMLIDSGHGVQGSFWRFSPLWESPFSEVSDLAHFLMWWLGPWGHHPHERVLMRRIQKAVLSEAVPKALPYLLGGSNHLSPISVDSFLPSLHSVLQLVF